MASNPKLREEKRLLKSRSKLYQRKPKSTVKHDAATLKVLRSFADNSSKSETKAVNALKELNFKYEVTADENGYNMFFFQDPLMQKFFFYYPEYLCVDILCEIPELDDILLLFIGVDSNGHCEIVSVGLLKCKNPHGFIWICDMFKKHNPGWEQIELILSDDSCDREILKAAFPGKLFFTSFFHSMKAFKLDLSRFDNGTAYEEINKTLQIFEQLMFITSEVGYTQLLKQMKQINAQAFNLFKKKWHGNKSLWALGLCTDSKIFLKAFNIYLLSIRRKFKPIICNQETFENVIRNLHSGIYKLRKEWFQQITKMFHSPSAFYLKETVMQKYASFITPFALELIYEQFMKSEDIKNLEKINRPGYYKVDETFVTSSSCSCNFNKLMKLPCCHIFSLRKHLSLTPFLQSVRWSWTTTSYYETFFALYSAHNCMKEDAKAIEMEHRYKEYVGICHELWREIFNSNENVSKERLETFQNILKGWKSDFKVSIITSEKQNDSLLNSNENLQNLPTDVFKELYGISIDEIINPQEEFMDVSLCPDDSIELL